MKVPMKTDKSSQHYARVSEIRAVDTLDLEVYETGRSMTGRYII